MTMNLTKPISFKLFVALLIVTLGAEVLLYLTRFSYLASDLYDAVMVSSLFIGWRISPRLGQIQEKKKTKRRIALQFTGAFLIFFLGSSLVNIYSGIVFSEFNDDYNHYVQDYTSTPSTQGEGTHSSSGSNTSPTFWDQVDTLGNDLYTDALAGLEEVWRLAYIILLLVVCKKWFPSRWESGKRDLFLLAALFLTSILFGIDHTLDAEESWRVRIGAIVTFGNMGFILGLILLWTRNLWLTVLVHSVYDMTTTISWYYYDYAVECLALIVLIVFIILLILEIRQKNRQLAAMGVEGIEVPEST
ncbi:CPBP family intramembrane metalloprotease [Bacillus sp. BRMEA1]|uniref:CPBP family intramembrane glutamic endopeptidase n=1 Tax=Neobacillus endophyticus TaxID=2738405 RepID=UPI001566F615|nr:CPBP family intramembrane glutamic endopeptidase [Neobacillus endophyticus]NRD76709.1 CPBP family intramembrane metalloprotease [Neobacillus endophyticus]